MLKRRRKVPQMLSSALKRIEFYRKNGILDTGYTLMDSAIKYMVLSLSPPYFNQIIW